MKERGATVLVVDSGGRGSVLAEKYSQSPHVDRVFRVGDGLVVIDSEKPIRTLPRLKTTDVQGILRFCEEERVTVVDVAQDNAIEAALVDLLEERGFYVVGPTYKAGRIEWDKAWAREFGARHKIPQPFFKICFSEDEGIRFIDSQADQKWFVKAAYLAEGKAVLPAENNEEAIKRIHELRKEFKRASQVFLVEKWLEGRDGWAEEFSSYVAVVGIQYKYIGSAQDHKRVENFDRGENTGGMGCSTPPLLLTPELLEEVEKRIIQRALTGLEQEGKPYKGILYLGGIVIRERSELAPYTIEFNARWGDPEAQVIIPGIVNDLFEISMAIAEGDIASLNIVTDGKARVVVAGTSKGYPRDYTLVEGKRVFGLEEAARIDGVRLYGAGVRVEDGKYYASGGRLFYLIGEGKDVIEAREKVYRAISVTSVEGNNLHFRTDIGWRDVERIRGSYK